MPTNAIANIQRVVVLMADPAAALDQLLAELDESFTQAQVTHLSAGDLAQLLSSPSPAPADWVGAVKWLRQGQFDAAIIATALGQTPYTLGYLCYLAGIPIRVGRSPEFGGQVLTHCLPPPASDLIKP